MIGQFNDILDLPTGIRIPSKLQIFRPHQTVNAEHLDIEASFLIHLKRLQSYCAYAGRMRHLPEPLLQYGKCLRRTWWQLTESAPDSTGEDSPGQATPHRHRLLPLYPQWDSHPRRTPKNVHDRQETVRFRHCRGS